MILAVCAIGYGALGLLVAIAATVHAVQLRQMFPPSVRTIGALLIGYAIAGITIAGGLNILRSRRWARLTLMWLGSLSLGMSVLWVALVAAAIGSMLMSPRQSHLDAVTGAALGDAVIVAIGQVFLTIVPVAGFLYGLTRPSVMEFCSD